LFVLGLTLRHYILFFQKEQPFFAQHVFSGLSDYAKSCLVSSLSDCFPAAFFNIFTVL
jgi:hypothetical protein